MGGAISETAISTVAPSLVRPIPIESPPIEDIHIGPAPKDVSPSIDWALQAQEVADATVNLPARREFVTAPHSSGPAHPARVQYRDEFGNATVWLNDHCYVYSEAPLLGAPGGFARMASTPLQDQGISAAR